MLCLPNFRAAILGVLLLATPIFAEEIRVKLYVEPESAYVRVHPGPEERLPAGAPFMVSLPDSPLEKVRFTLEAEGYQPLVLELSALELRGTRRFPASGAYRLRRPWALLALPVLAALPLAAGAFWLWRRRRHSHSEPTYAGDPTVVVAMPGKAEAPFILKNKIAEGGMAIVYQGTSPKAPDRDVAIKIVRPELLEDPDTKKRFVREMEICARLDHPHLVKVFDSGVSLEGEMYLVMELLRGLTLAEELEYDPTPEPAKIASVLLPLCEALGYIHGMGLVHRDVKPANVFLDDQAGVKLVDLGIARGLDFEAVTRTGMAVGSPHYMAPEQAKGDVRPENDQYSVGVLLFEMLTGDRPYPDGDPIEVITQHLTAPVPSLYPSASHVGPLLEAVVQRLMAKRPEGRFGSILDAATAIQGALLAQGGADEATCDVIIPRE